MDAGNMSTSLFDVYLRLRPSLTGATERFIDVEAPDFDSYPKHITIKPPVNDVRKKAVEKFAFTRVFEPAAGQLDLFHGTGVLQLLEGVLGSEGRNRDGLIATLGVTGSGKSHTILGSKTQRGLTQMSLNVLFSSIATNIVHPTCAASVFQSVAESDATEAQMFSAPMFLDPSIELSSTRGSVSRAQTPMPDLSLMSITTGTRSKLPAVSSLPKLPDMEGIGSSIDPAYEYVLVVSMYEVYNDRIFDLLAGQACSNRKAPVRRRALLFKNTEGSPDRKIVAGLKKVMCCTMEEALMVLETGLLERKVAGTGSNAVSSRSHGFFCVEVKKRHRVRKGTWHGQTLTVVDLAGSERARNAKTAGATLAEAGKINESLMYLGQCMQMQSENGDGHKAIVPFRQCKLTELLFSNSFPSQSSSHRSPRPQKAIMIVTADPTGDFNATSQILRYSALAREITVPRIPSVTSQLLGAHIPRPGSSSSERSSMGASSSEAMAEVARLTDEVAVLSIQLEDERSRREAAEQSWTVSEQKVDELEESIRAEIWEEMEDILLAEKQKWRLHWESEAERGEERVDAKIEILARGTIDDEESPSSDGSEQDKLLHEEIRLLREENERLRAKNDLLEREKMLKTPSGGKKQRVLKSRKWETEEDLETSS